MDKSRFGWHSACHPAGGLDPEILVSHASIARTNESFRNNKPTVAVVRIALLVLGLAPGAG